MGQRPPYVDVLNNRCDRAAICKIHISAHPLMIERRRHLKIPRTERYCLLCKSNQTEDEKHFLLHCKKFNTQRNIFNEKISNIIENASYKNANNKMGSQLIHVIYKYKYKYFISTNSSTING
jgi:hypothetical protein